MAGELVRALFVGSQKIHQHSAERALTKTLGDELIARTMPAAPAPVHEQHDAGCLWIDVDVGLEVHAINFKMGGAFLNRHGLHASWKCLGRLVPDPSSRHFEGAQRRRVVEVDDGIKL